MRFPSELLIFSVIKIKRKMFSGISCRYRTVESSILTCLVVRQPENETNNIIVRIV